MLAEKQHDTQIQRNKDYKGIFAKVASNNIASNKVFSSSLKWDEVTCDDARTSLFDTLSQKGTPPNRDRTWYKLDKDALIHSYALLTKVKATGVLCSKSGNRVPTLISDGKRQHISEYDGFTAHNNLAPINSMN